MIKRLQLKIIAVVLGAILIVFTAVLLMLNISVHQMSGYRTRDFMTSVVENDGFSFIPRDRPDRAPGGWGRPPDNPETMRAGRFFYAKLSHDAEIFELNLEMMFDFSSDDALEYISNALDSRRENGNIDNYSYILAEKPYGQLIVFAERSLEISLLEQLSRVSYWAAAIVGLALACIAAFLVKWMVAPVKDTLEKQRRFISDASHELKTPLTIISANAEVLENEIGSNQWLTHIKAQSGRMNGLIQDLLSLAKMDESQSKRILSEFNLSGAVLNTVLEFESLAFEEGKQYAYDIKENITYTGDEKQIKYLVSILIENAILYSDANGRIEVSLHAEGNRVRISVYNTGTGIPDDEQSKIFERFYRVDESRSRDTGGYGVGLSIAKAITEAHKGKIAVSGKYGEWTQFDVII